MAEGDITDESGNLLGGKRAAMQFAHNKVRSLSVPVVVSSRCVSMVFFRTENQVYV